MTTPLPEGASLSISSTVSTQRGMKWDRTADGALFGRDMYAQPKYIINAQFNVLTEAIGETLENFLQNYRTQPITVTIRQYTYSAYVTGDPSRGYLGGDGLIKINVEMEGVRV